MNSFTEKHPRNFKTDPNAKLITLFESLVIYSQNENYLRNHLVIQ